jgi:hypothetical protein
MFHQAAHKGAVDERHVTDEHHHVTAEVGERLHRATHRVAGTEPLCLHNTFATRRQQRHDLVVTLGGNDHDALRSERQRRVDHIGQHRSSANGVQHLGEIGSHTRTQTGRQDHDGEGGARLWLRLRHCSRFTGFLAGAGGFEPPVSGPKPGALPLGHAPSQSARQYITSAPAADAADGPCAGVWRALRLCRSTANGAPRRAPVPAAADR